MHHSAFINWHLFQLLRFTDFVTRPFEVMARELTRENLGLASNSFLTVEDSQSMRDHDVSPIPLSRASMCSQDSCHTEEAEPQGLINVMIRPPTLKRTHSGGAPGGMAAYQMNAKPRGVALILANEKYDNDVQDERYGSQFDRQNLSSLLTKLEFTVEEKINLTKMDMIQTLQKFADDERHKTADMMILTILSHGTEGAIDTTDGLRIDHERIFEQFNNHQCPHLKGKPKLFLISVRQHEHKGIIQLKYTFYLLSTYCRKSDIL